MDGIKLKADDFYIKVSKNTNCDINYTKWFTVSKVYTYNIIFSKQQLLDFYKNTRNWYLKLNLKIYIINEWNK